MPVGTARIDRASHDVDLERRINSQAEMVPRDEAPPYESQIPQKIENRGHQTL